MLRGSKDGTIRKTETWTKEIEDIKEEAHIPKSGLLILTHLIFKLVAHYIFFLFYIWNLAGH
jgi:hypothetical protein